MLRNYPLSHRIMIKNNMTITQNLDQFSGLPICYLNHQVNSSDMAKQNRYIWLRKSYDETLPLEIFVCMYSQSCWSSLSCVTATFASIKRTNATIRMNVGERVRQDPSLPSWAPRSWVVGSNRWTVEANW